MTVELSSSCHLPVFGSAFTVLVRFGFAGLVLHLEHDPRLVLSLHSGRRFAGILGLEGDRGDFPEVPVLDSLVRRPGKVKELQEVHHFQNHIGPHLPVRDAGYLSAEKEVLRRMVPSFVSDSWFERLLTGLV